jgi:hypothetical protein
MAAVLFLVALLVLGPFVWVGPGRQEPHHLAFDGLRWRIPPYRADVAAALALYPTAAIGLAPLLALSIGNIELALVAGLLGPVLACLWFAGAVLSMSTLGATVVRAGPSGIEVTGRWPRRQDRRWWRDVRAVRVEGGRLVLEGARPLVLRVPRAGSDELAKVVAVLEGTRQHALERPVAPPVPDGLSGLRQSVTRARAWRIRRRAAHRIA